MYIREGIYTFDLAILAYLLDNVKRGKYSIELLLYKLFHPLPKMRPVTLRPSRGFASA